MSIFCPRYKIFFLQNFDDYIETNEDECASDNEGDCDDNFSGKYEDDNDTDDDDVFCHQLCQLIFFFRG